MTGTALFMPLALCDVTLSEYHLRFFSRLGKMILSVPVSLIHGSVSLFKDAQQRIMTLFIILDHTGRNGFSNSDFCAVRRKLVDLLHQFCPLIIIFSGENGNELVSAYLSLCVT